jgi:hypothetical protein
MRGNTLIQVTLFAFGSVLCGLLLGYEPAARADTGCDCDSRDNADEFRDPGAVACRSKSTAGRSRGEFLRAFEPLTVEVDVRVFRDAYFRA